MFRVTRQFLLALILGVMIIGPLAQRVEASDKLNLHMVMTMAGVTAGSVKLSIDEDETETVSKLAMKSQGLFKFLTGYKSKSEARSSAGADGKSPLPISFNSSYETNKTDRQVEIRYDDETGEISTLGSWKRGEPRKSKVPADLRSATVDPLTAMIRFRHWIRELRGQDGVHNIAAGLPEAKSKLLDVFDGRRRYRLAIELLERKDVRLGDDRVPALRFKVDMTAMAGFSKKDMLANWSSEDGQRWIEVIVTDDEDPVPISMSTVGGTLETNIYLRKICRSGQNCVKIKG